MNNFSTSSLAVFNKYNAEMAASNQRGTDVALISAANGLDVASDLVRLGLMEIDANGQFQKAKTSLSRVQRQNADDYLGHLMMMGGADCVKFDAQGNYTYKNERGRVAQFQKHLIKALAGNDGKDLENTHIDGTRHVWLYEGAKQEAVNAAELGQTPAMKAVPKNDKKPSLLTRLKNMATSFIPQSPMVRGGIAAALLFVGTVGSSFAKFGGKDTRGDLARHDEHKTEAVAAKPETAKPTPQIQEVHITRYVDTDEMGNEFTVNIDTTDVVYANPAPAVKAAKPQAVAMAAADNTPVRKNTEVKFTEQKDTVVTPAPAPAEELVVTQPAMERATIVLQTPAEGFVQTMTKSYGFRSNSGIMVGSDGKSYPIGAEVTQDQYEMGKKYSANAESIAAKPQQTKNNSFVARLTR